jgi:molecular chaperone GrpE
MTSVSDESPSPVQDPEPEARIAALAKERDSLAAERADLNDRLLRRQAEFENFRRRAERERSEFIQYAAGETIAELLPVLDDFERALKSTCPDENYAKGIELIYQRFLDALKRQGLEPMESAGKPFDPRQHQAVDRAQRDDVDDQTVLEEYQRGYNFKGKLLRPAMVKVAVKS